MKCIICQHNQIKDIDRALLTGATLNSLSQKYGFSTSALQRHKEHLLEKMAQAKTRFRESLHQGCFIKLINILELTLHTVRAARDGGDFKLALQASREVTSILKLLIKMGFNLDQEMAYRLLTSPQWNLHDSLLSGTYQAFCDARQAIAADLFRPCPKSAPEPTLDKAPASFPEAQDPGPANLLPAAASPEKQFGQKNQHGEKISEKREKGGKLPGKTHLARKISKENQRNTDSEKNSGKSLGSNKPNSIGKGSQPLNSSLAPVPAQNPTKETGNPELENQTFTDSGRDHQSWLQRYLQKWEKNEESSAKKSCQEDTTKEIH